MPADNLWGDLKITPSRTPYTILKEQAEKLTELTGYTLHGEVAQREWGGKFKVGLLIRVPALDDYRFEILEVTYNIDLYPLELQDVVHQRRASCNNEEEFLAEVKKVLQSPEIRSAISVLLSQASG